MNFTQRARGIVQAIAVVLSLALPLVVSGSRRPTPGSAAASARARAARGRFPRRPAPRLRRAPRNRSTAPSPSRAAPAWRARGGGFFNRPGRGLLGGLAAGFLGAGLLGMLFGGGLFGGIGGFSSIFGLILQIGLIVFVVRMAMSWWQRRHQTATAYAGGRFAGSAPRRASGSGTGFGLGSGSAPLEILPADYEAFERLLGEIQAAWSNEDVARLHTLATPEMVSYFARDLDAEQGARTSSTRFPAPGFCKAISPKPGARAIPIMRAWRCGFRWSTRRSIAPPAGWSKAASSRTEVTEVWTFLRPRGAIGNCRRSSRPDLARKS